MVGLLIGKMIKDVNKKKAQVTVFVIVAVVIIAGIGGFIYYNGELGLGENVDPVVEPVYLYVENCMEETAKNAILDTSQFGGYFISPDLSIDNGMPYYLYDERDNMPSKREISEQISLYLDSSLFFCLGEFEDFSGFEITAGPSETIVTIEDEEVIFNIKYPLTVTKGNSSFVFEDFVVKVPARLGVIYDSIDYYMNEQMISPKGICVTCAHEISTTEDLYFNTIDYDEETVIFTIKDENIKINKEDLVFNFANQYEGI